MKDLFEKRIDLKNCQINGGRLAESQATIRTETCSGGCSDVRYTVKDDSYKTIQVCTDYNC
nr:hypothetical protein [Pedobacter kyonggii]